MIEIISRKSDSCKFCKENERSKIKNESIRLSGACLLVRGDRHILLPDVRQSGQWLQNGRSVKGSECEKDPF